MSKATTSSAQILTQVCVRCNAPALKRCICKTCLAEELKNPPVIDPSQIGYTHNGRPYIKLNIIR